MEASTVSTPSSKLLSISWYFFFIGFAIGNWISRLADIREHNHLSYTMLGSLLVLAAIGALISLPIVSELSKRYGSAKCLLIGGLWLCLSIPPLGITNVAMGFSDVSMTAQAIMLEKERHINYMGSCQACQSLGGFIGVIVGGTMAALGVSTFLDFLLISVSSLPIALCTYPFLYNNDHEQMVEAQKGGDTEEAADAVSGGSVGDEVTSQEALLSEEAKLERWHVLVYLTVMGFCAQIGEGTISDWSTLYFRDDLGVTSGVVTVSGFAAFSLMMAVGR